MKSYTVTVIDKRRVMREVQLTANSDDEARRLAEPHGTVIMMSTESDAVDYDDDDSSNQPTTGGRQTAG